MALFGLRNTEKLGATLYWGPQRNHDFDSPPLIWSFSKKGDPKIDLQIFKILLSLLIMGTSKLVPLILANPGMVALIISL